MQAIFYTGLVIGYMMGLSADQLAGVQRIAGSLGLAINQSAVGEVTDWRHCTYAACAMRALQAVRMVQAGFEATYHPTTRAGQTRSIPYCVAAALVKKTIEYSFFEDNFLDNDAGVGSLMQKITIEEDNQMNLARNGWLTH